MLGIGGWKTIVGVIFGAFTMVLPQAKELINPVVFQWLMIICGFIGAVLTGLGVVHKFEKGVDKISKSQAGNAKMPVVAALLAMSLIGCQLLVFGCAPNQTATQQILKQTDDPAVIALATYSDAIGIYIDAQEAYKPYAKYAERNYPVMAKDIIDKFGEARKILNKWKKFGRVDGDENLTFRAYIREILLEAMILSEGSE